MTKFFTLSLFCMMIFAANAQKTTGTINLTTGMTANFTLDNTTSKVTLVLTGPSDRWFALGFGSSVTSGFGMGSGDVLVYTTSLSDRNYVGMSAPATDATQSWTVLSNTVASGTRTITAERALTNSDGNDTQLPYATTNTINLAWAKSSSASTTLANHGTGNRGFATGTFNLSLDDIESSKNTFTISPNPAKNSFNIQTKNQIKQVSIFDASGKQLKVFSQSEKYEISTLENGTYFIEIIDNEGNINNQKLIKN